MNAPATPSRLLHARQIHVRAMVTEAQIEGVIPINTDDTAGVAYHYTNMSSTVILRKPGEPRQSLTLCFCVTRALLGRRAQASFVEAARLVG